MISPLALVFWVGRRETAYRHSFLSGDGLQALLPVGRQETEEPGIPYLSPTLKHGRKTPVSRPETHTPEQSPDPGTIPMSSLPT